MLRHAKSARALISITCPCEVINVPFTASQINPDWVKTAARPFDPPLTEFGEEQVQPVAQPVTFYSSTCLY